MGPIVILLFPLLCQSTLAAECNSVHLGDLMGNLFYSLSQSNTQDEVDLGCSAIILNSNWLLSPASCLANHNNPSAYKIKLRAADENRERYPSKVRFDLNLYKQLNCNSMPRLEFCLQIVRNPSYNNELGAGWDLALLYVDNQLPGLTCPIRLAQEEDYPYLDDCIFVKSPNFSPEPIEVHASIDSCKSSRHVTSGEVSSALVECANKSVCQGEAGAVVLCFGRDKTQGMLLRDISSWSDQFCRSSNGYLFTKTFSYNFHWINTTISAL